MGSIFTDTEGIGAAKNAKEGRICRTLTHPEELIQQYRAEGHWNGRSITQVLESHARRIPDRVALIDACGALTWAELS